MSKKKVLELIAMDEQELAAWLCVVGVEEFRSMLRLALEEQDRDTRHACAEAINHLDEPSRWKDFVAKTVASAVRNNAYGIAMNCRGGLPDKF